MKDYRSLWEKPHLVAAVMAGTAGVLAAAALGYALLGPGAPVSAAGAAGQVQEGPVEGYEAADHQNDEDTSQFPGWTHRRSLRRAGRTGDSIWKIPGRTATISRRILSWRLGR